MVQTRTQTYHANSKKIVNPDKYLNSQPIYKNDNKNVKFEEDFCNITHFHENTRIVTIAFFYHSENETVRYGATIYQKDPKNPWNKKEHVKTAKNRFHIRPVELVSFSPEAGKFREHLRKQLFLFGVQGARN